MALTSARRFLGTTVHVAVLLALVLAVTAGCTGNASRSAQGEIIDVQATSLTEWDSLTVRTASGEELTFLSGAGIDLVFWRASHLREHMLAGEHVTVTYETTDPGLVATSIDD